MPADIEQRQREALVPAGLLERVVADETDPLERPPLGGFEDRRLGRQLVQLPGDGEDLVEVRVEHRLEAATFRPRVSPASRASSRLVRRARARTATSRMTTATHSPTTSVPRYGCTRALRSIRGSSEGRAESSRASFAGPYPPECYPLPSAARAARRHAARAPARHPDGGPRQIMAKRVRGSTSRPGQRAPLQKTAVPAAQPSRSRRRREVAPRSESLTDAEEARAAVLEAAIVAQEREHEAASRSTRAARSADPSVGRPGSGLAISAADEYAVRGPRHPTDRDRRRIAHRDPARAVDRRSPSRGSRSSDPPLTPRRAGPARRATIRHAIRPSTDRRPTRGPVPATARAAAARRADATARPRGVRRPGAPRRRARSAPPKHRPRPPRRRSCCGVRPGPARPASPGCSPARSAPTSSRCRRSCRASSRSARRSPRPRSGSPCTGRARSCSSTRSIASTRPSRTPCCRTSRTARSRSIGATTENPYFEVNAALLSRMRVWRLEAADRRRRREPSSDGRSADEERGLAGPLGPTGGVALSRRRLRPPRLAGRRRRPVRPQRPRGRDGPGRVRGDPRRRRPRQPATRGRRGGGPAAGPRLRPRRRRPLRHRLARSSRACAATTRTRRSTGWPR